MNETKQVPVEPTEFMLDEGRMALSRNGGEGTPEQLISDCQVVYKAMLAAAPAIDHPAHTHCANCGCIWLDNGLNPAWCPYCKATEPSDVERLYYELLNAVTNKQEGKTRHEIALGYIQAVDNIGKHHKGYQSEKAEEPKP